MLFQVYPRVVACFAGEANFCLVLCSGFKPKYCIGHPERYLFLLSINIFSRSKYPKIILFKVENRSTGGLTQLLMPLVCNHWRIVNACLHRICVAAVGDMQRFFCSSVVFDPFTGVAVLAEIPLRSPRKLLFLLSKNIFIGSKYPKIN